MSYLTMAFATALILSSSGSLTVAIAKMESTRKFVLLNQAWSFRPDNGETARPILVGFDLADQIPHGYCCSGEYQTRLQLDDVTASLSESHFRTPALYLPAVGGSAKLRINGQDIDLPKRDLSTVGPVIQIPDRLVAAAQLDINLRVEGPRTPFAGLWKSAPMLGERFELEEFRNRDIFWQSTLPWLSSTILLFFALTFGWIYVQTGARFQQYLWFSFALLAWATYFLFVSGVPRDAHYYFGSMALFPSRTIAGFGLFLIIAAHFRVPRQELWTFAFIFFGLSGIQFLFGVAGNPTLQTVLLVTAGPLSMYPMRYVDWSKRGHFTWLICLLGSVAFLGQTCDSIKLLDGFFHFHWPLPYLNRVTIVPLLLTSIVTFIRQFSGYFHELREETLKARGLARSAFNLTKREISIKELTRAIRPVRQTYGVRRLSLLERRTSGDYEVKAVSGVSPKAIGSILTPEAHAHISKAIKTGKIQLQNAISMRSSLWETTSCIAVPIPLSPQPDFLLLLSDPLRKTEFDESDIPHLSHFSSALWANVERSKYQHKFSTIFSTLDPTLYSYILEKVEAVGDKEIKASPERGIVFLDQKNFTTLMEQLPEQDIPRFADTVHGWLTAAAARFGARVISNPGDAFLLDIFSLVGETAEQIGTRTVEVTWHLQETLPQLNQNLLSRGFDPVLFRFGAHFGTAAPVSVNFIRSGSENILGDNVNIAQRIQDIAPPGRMLITGELAKLVSESFVVREVPRKFVKGRGHPVVVFEVIGRIEKERESAA